MLATRHSVGPCYGPKTIQRALPPPTWQAARNSWAGSGRAAARLPCAAPGNNGNSSGSGMPNARMEDQEPSLVHKGSGPGSMVAQSEAIAAPLLSQCLDDDKELFVTTQGVVVDRVDEQTAEFDYLGETTEGNLHLVERLKRAGVVGGILGLSSLEDIYSVDPKKLRAATQEVLNELEVPPQYPGGNPERGVYCSRTLNLRSIKAIGFDMDYTCISYDVNAWEGRAYEYGMDSLRAQGVPVEGLRFDPDMVIRGLIMDKDKGNLIKVDRFGLVKRAMHGTRMLSWQEIREAYGRELVNLRNEGRWVFLNTLFSVSEAVMYMQLVDRLDQGHPFAPTLSSGTGLSYQGLYSLVASAMYRTHVEGKLKSEIIQAPEKFVELDPDMARTLQDQKDSGKLLLLITNSDYEYTHRMMSYAYDCYMPEGQTWRDLFDMVIVMARKPDFFNYSMPLYEVVTPDGLMKPALAAKQGGLYCGGSARMVEKALGVEGDDVLYVGDHIYTDAALAKINFRWRTALILRELEEEVAALTAGRPHSEALKELMGKKEVIGDLFNNLRLARQRALSGRKGADDSFDDEAAVNETLAQLLLVMEKLDERIGPMLEQDGRQFNTRWGYLSRAGLNDKSQLFRQIEKYADVYTSRVSNLLRYTPYMYFRSPSQSLAHDRNLTAYYTAMQRHQQQHAGHGNDAASKDGPLGSSSSSSSSSSGGGSDGSSKVGAVGSFSGLMGSSSDSGASLSM